MPLMHVHINYIKSERMNICFQVEKTQYDAFISAVGKGNMSTMLRNYIESYSEDSDVSERKLRKELEFLMPKHLKIKQKVDKIEQKLAIFDQKRKQKELEMLKKQKKEFEKLKKIEMETAKKDSTRVIMEMLKR